MALQQFWVPRRANQSDARNQQRSNWLRDRFHCPLGTLEPIKGSSYQLMWFHKTCSPTIFPQRSTDIFPRHLDILSENPTGWNASESAFRLSSLMDVSGTKYARLQFLKAIGHFDPLFQIHLSGNWSNNGAACDKNLTHFWRHSYGTTPFWYWQNQ